MSTQEFSKGVNDYINGSDYDITKSVEWKNGYSYQAIRDDRIYNEGYSCGLIKAGNPLGDGGGLYYGYEGNIYDKGYNDGSKQSFIKYKKRKLNK